MLLSHGFFPLDTLPTRVTNDTVTVIDHILTNDINHSIRPGVIQTQEVSDHYVIYCYINNLATCEKA